MNEWIDLKALSIPGPVKVLSSCGGWCDCSFQGYVTSIISLWCVIKKKI